MSVTMMSRVWQMDLPANEMLVLLAFADHANDEGMMWPSYDRVAWKTGYNKESIKRIVKSLTEKKILLRRGGGNGRGYANVFKIMVENAPMKDDISIDKGGEIDTPSIDKGGDFNTPSEIEKGGDLREKGGDPDIKGGSKSPPQPSLTIIEPIESEKKISDLTPAGAEFFRQFKRKRWTTPQQQDEFEMTETKVGTDIMLDAVKWAAMNGIARVGAICTTAKKMAKDRTVKPQSGGLTGGWIPQGGTRNGNRQTG